MSKKEHFLDITNKVKNQVKLRQIIRRKRYGIIKRDQNLMDLTLNFVYGIVLISSLLFDQVKNVSLEVFNEDLGTELAFQLWLSGFIFDSICKYELSRNDINSNFRYQIII